MPSVADLQPKQEFTHPDTGQRVTVDRVRVLKAGVRVYFKAHGISGWVLLPPETHIELAPERSQRDNTRRGRG